MFTIRRDFGGHGHVDVDSDGDDDVLVTRSITQEPLSYLATYLNVNHSHLAEKGLDY